MPSARSPEVPIEDLLSALEQAAPRPLTVRELAKRLGLERFDPRALAAQLEQQVAARKLRRIGKTRYQFARDIVEKKARSARTPRAPLEVTGRYTRARGGFGFVEVFGSAKETLRGDLHIPRGHDGDALHGDRVRARILRRDARLGRATGRVVEVLERAHTSLLGRLEPTWGARRRSTPTGWRMIPFSELLPFVEIAPGPVSLGEEHAGRTALVRLIRPPFVGSPWRGTVERLLGDVDDPEVQFLSIALEHALRTEFPPDARAEAERLPRDPRPSDIAGREDLRDMPFVTIDGESARDFDDAVCLERTGDGFRLHVAIADVSFYVTPGSALDAEAALRGTSVYFPDRAIPMLPERLSTELCSLKPDRERVVQVAEMHYDRSGVRQSASFFRGVIRSRARLTYTEVAALLAETDVPEMRRRREELGDIVTMLGHMRALMRLLYKRRVAAGSLDLDLPESLIDLSDEGRAVGIRLAPRNDAHRMIEEFMLEANRAVAGWLEDNGLPLPYRIHEPPDPGDIEELNALLHSVGLFIDARRGIEPRDVQGILDRLKGHPLERVLSRHVLRAFKQARYSTENEGHFGLAFKVYCHFTSPIRRYPDLLVHRQVAHLLAGEVAQGQAAAPELAVSSEQSSRSEREAMEAERAMVDLKKAEFMLGHMLEPGPATIVTVAKFGFFVELDATPIEGLVPAGDLPGLWWFDERSHSLRAERSGRRYRLGDRLTVEATQVSLARRQITFGIVEEGLVRSAASAPGLPAAERAEKRSELRPRERGRPRPTTPRGRGPRTEKPRRR